MNAPKQKIVFLLHGVNTHAAWERDIAPVLAAHDVIPYSLNYGFVHPLRIYDPFTRNSKLLQLRAAYDGIVKHTGVTRPSIIAHSFGTWLLGALLNRYDDVYFDKVILTGSLLPCSYDWSSLLNGHNPRVCSLINERQTSDFPVKVAAATGKFGYGYGSGGVDGFENVLDISGNPHPNFKEFIQNVGHSDAFNESRFKQWAKWISAPIIPPESRAIIDKSLLFGFTTFAKRVGLPENKLRLCLLVPDADMSTLVPANSAASQFQIPLNDKIIGIELALSNQYAAAYSFVYNRTCLKKNIPSINAGGPKLSFVATAPIRHPVNGKLLGVVGVDSTDMGLQLPLEGAIKLAITKLATEVANVYSTKPNGV